MNTRRYPRTLKEAFGPYTDSRVAPPHKKPPPWMRRLTNFVLKLRGRWPKS